MTCDTSEEKTQVEVTNAKESGRFDYWMCKIVRRMSGRIILDNEVSKRTRFWNCSTCLPIPRSWSSAVEFSCGSPSLLRVDKAIWIACASRPEGAIIPILVDPTHIETIIKIGAAEKEICRHSTYSCGGSHKVGPVTLGYDSVFRYDMYSANMVNIGNLLFYELRVTDRYGRWPGLTESTGVE